MHTEKSKKTKTSDKEILEIARKRFALAEEAERDIREQALDDLKFRAGEQWPDSVKRERESDGRPCLVINRIPQFIRQITNDQRQNRPSIKVHPVDDKADVETAKIYQGLIRHIEYNSGADTAYDTAFEGAASKSFGYFRVITDYVDPMSFEQEILIKRIDNDFMVYLDPSSKEPDGSDANWGFVFEDVPKDDYEAEYGETELASGDDWSSVGSSYADWVRKDTVRIAEYFYKEYKTVTLALIDGGRTINKEDLDELNQGLSEPIEIISERQTKVPVIKWCKINGMEILEETTWSGRWIPIIPVYGDMLNIDGKRILEGVIRHAKDSQRMYNYWASTETESISLAPKAPFIVAEGQIPPEYEGQWRAANRKSHAYLPYVPVSINGQPVSPPQRNVYEPAIQAITNARLQAADDMKATTGIYDSALGNRSNESSGVAIQRRNMQSQTSNFHLIDNLTRSIRHTGRILVDLIPKIYDTARAARIIGEEGEQEIVRINEEFKKQNGESVFYNLGVGKYDVAVDVGPAYATKRQEAAASMESMAKSIPLLGQVAPDLIVKNMDWPGAHELAERLKKTLPPELSEDKEKKPIPPEIQAQMQQMNQMVEQLSASLDEAHKTIDQKTIEIESKERIEFAKMETDLKKEMMKAAPQNMFELMAQQIADINARLTLVGINRPVEPEEHEQGEYEGGMQATAPQQIQQPTDGFSSGPPPQGEYEQ